MKVVKVLFTDEAYALLLRERKCGLVARKRKDGEITVSEEGK